MTRRLLPLALAAALALALAACPLPQPVPDVARTVDGGAIATPIILPDSAVPPETTVYVRRDCPGGAQFALAVDVEDLDTTEDVAARWFVNYGNSATAFLGEVPVPASGDPNDPRRAVPAPFAGFFRPYDFDAVVTTGPVPPPAHVVEVVVSNGFLPVGNPTPPLQRAPQASFVTQLYRWVFQYVDQADPRGRCQ